MIGKRLKNNCSHDIVINDITIPANSSITITAKKFIELCNNSNVLSNSIKNKSVIAFNTNIDNKITIPSNNTNNVDTNTTYNVELQTSESNIVDTNNVETVVDETPKKPTTKKGRKRKNTKNN